ncbi:olfactory receptor 2AJ1-like [Notamacropus eugenii]|uniref:olfactory receptor 2AJ1-like n=1 Tax=Notamacropus eugenii TaxID=9315 RepID=UPI003B6830A0
MWENENQTFAKDFILLGLFHADLWGCLFLTFILIVFLWTIMGNAGLILLIRLNSQLHTPMYFLLSHLSFIDILTISNVVPNMASNFISGQLSITFAGCGFQLFLYIIFVGAECLVFTTMSYDRYVAICHPLHYPILMNHRISAGMAAGFWLGGVVNSTIHTAYVLHLPYCGTRVIDHFFCEIQAMLKISCADTSQYERGVFISAVFFFVIPFSVILASYAQILHTVLQMKSADAQKKAFSTCSSHLIVLAMYYGPCVFAYMRPKSYHTTSQDKVLAILYTIVTPMLNPIIYSLRNKDVLCALKKLLGKTLSHRN